MICDYSRPLSVIHSRLLLHMEPVAVAAGMNPRPLFLLQHDVYYILTDSLASKSLMPADFLQYKLEYSLTG